MIIKIIFFFIIINSFFIKTIHSWGTDEENLVIDLGCQKQTTFTLIVEKEEEEEENHQDYRLLKGKKLWQRKRKQIKNVTGKKKSDKKSTGEEENKTCLLDGREVRIIKRLKVRCLSAAEGTLEPSVSPTISSSSSSDYYDNTPTSDMFIDVKPVNG